MLGKYLIPYFDLCCPAGNKVIPKPSPMKPGDKLAMKSSPVKVGVKRKAADETQCPTKVRERRMMGQASLAQGLEFQALVCEVEKVSVPIGLGEGYESFPSCLASEQSCYSTLCPFVALQRRRVSQQRGRRAGGRR